MWSSPACADTTLLRTWVTVQPGSTARGDWLVERVSWSFFLFWACLSARSFRVSTVVLVGLGWRWSVWSWGRVRRGTVRPIVPGSSPGPGGWEVQGEAAC